jgi:endo-chitodextinase
MHKNPQSWMMVKNRALYREIKKQGKKLIYGLGGESDLKGFMSLEQVQDFADYVVYMLGIAGDGINLDFEHMSENANK